MHGTADERGRGRSRLDVVLPGAVHDTMLLFRRCHPGERRHGLGDVLRRSKISAEGQQRRRWIDDVLLTAEARLQLAARVAERGEARERVPRERSRTRRSGTEHRSDGVLTRCGERAQAPW